MKPATVIAPYASLDTAIAVAKRLQRDCRAELEDVDAFGSETTITLRIPAEGLPGVERLRRHTWVTFVHRVCRENRGGYLERARAIRSHWDAIEANRQRLERNRVMIETKAKDLAGSSPSPATAAPSPV